MKKKYLILMMLVCGITFSQNNQNQLINANELASSNIGALKSMTHIDDGLKNAMNGKMDYLVTNNNQILIRAFHNGNLANLEQDLKSTMTCKDLKNRGSYFTLWVPINEIAKLETITSLKYSVAIEAPVTNGFSKEVLKAKNKNVKNLFNEQPLFSGNVVTQGDAAILTDDLRANSGVNGAGVTIGVLSNSYATLDGASTAISQAIADGELPGPGNPNGFTTPVTILLEGADSNDEGRAMIEIIHDVAPGATLLFRTARFGQEDYADGIRELRDAGADIIVDDINFFDEPMFQDGIIAQAVSEVTADGVIYFTAALNAGFNGFNSNYIRDPSSPNIGGEFGNSFHDFGTNGTATRIDVVFDGGSDNPQTANISVLELNTTAGFFHDTSLQWDDPSIIFSNPNEILGDDGVVLSPQTDLTLTFIANVNGVVRPIAWSTQQSILVGTPFDRLAFRDNNNVSQIFLAISVRDGVDPNAIRFVNFNISYGFSPFAGTLVGHANSEDAIAVGAVRFDNTPEFGTNPPVRQNSSSGGGLSVLLDEIGNRLEIGRVLEKPEFMGPDGVNTTFFGNDSNIDPDAFPNFFGTSAAAPHAAAAAALILEGASNETFTGVTKDQIVSAFQETAIDMTNTVGYDVSTGFGFIQAPDALASLLSTLDVNTSELNDNNTLVVFPNPTSDGNITISQLQNSIGSDLNISVFNVLGQQVYNESQNISEASVNINLSALGEGIYFLQSQISGSTETHKIIIE